MELIHNPLILVDILVELMLTYIMGHDSGLFMATRVLFCHDIVKDNCSPLLCVPLAIGFILLKVIV